MGTLRRRRVLRGPGVAVGLWAGLFVACAAGCGDGGMPAGQPDGGTPAGAQALYDTSSSRADFFALPWPSDARLTPASGGGTAHIDLTGVHDPGGQIGEYLADISGDDLGGFGTQSAIYFRFDAPIDPASLPAGPAESMLPTSAAFLVDVTPGSPEYGKRLPVRVHTSNSAGLYIGPDWLAIRPEPGFPLRQATKYAAVLTDGLRAADGGPVRADPRFDLPLDGLPLGLPDGAHVVSATVFTTGHFTDVVKRLRQAVRATAAPTIDDASLKFDGVDGSKAFETFEGVYASPNFQQGDPPYLRSGGSLDLAADGTPQVVRTEMIRFALTIPTGVAMPQGGWPVVLYGHGTGGDYKSFIDDDSALAAASAIDKDGHPIAHMAMIGIDMPLQGTRDPTHSDPDLTFVNLLNLPAARDNIRQGAADLFQLVRFVEGLDVKSAPGTQEAIRFDPDRIYYKGHSEGALIGSLFLAYEPDVKAAVLSGDGANLVLSLLQKTEPTNIPQLITAIVGEDVDEFHPLLNLVQTFLEPADPGNYARFLFREPPAGQAPKSIFHSLGIVDHYTPIPTIEALALAMGVSPVNPELQTVDDFGIDGASWLDAPVTGNVAGGAATGVLCEYKVPLKPDMTQAYDGHFVVLDDPLAKRQSNAFLATQARDGKAQLLP